MCMYIYIYTYYTYRPCSTPVPPPCSSGRESADPSPWPKVDAKTSSSDGKLSLELGISREYLWNICG